MADYLVRATAADDYIRAFAVTTRDLTEEARERHGLSSTAAAALGRTMAAGLMMGADLKGAQDVITLQFVCDGPIGGITVTSGPNGEVKGFVNNPGVTLPPNAAGKLNVGGAVGSGVLHVLRDTGLKEPYAGEVEIASGEIAEDLARYFAVSEQVPSAVALGVLVDTDTRKIREAGGYIIQLMPGCPDETAEALEKACTLAPSVTDILKKERSAEALLEQVLSGFDLKIREKMPVRFACNCSRERVSKALIAMGSGELRSLIAEGEPVTLNCHFCNTNYTFGQEELIELLAEAMKKRAPARSDGEAAGASGNN